MSGRQYSVKAVWRTLQGEGAWAGRAAVFVRFTGCNLWSGHDADRARDVSLHGAECPLWCDTDFAREGSSKLRAHELVEEMRAVGGDIRFCVLTGGEPFLQLDSSLIRELHHAGFFVATETNGTRTLAETFDDERPDWTVCSPKLSAEKIVLEAMDELKLVVPDYLPSAYEPLVARVRTHSLGGSPRRNLWLQPEDGPRVAEATRLAVEHVLANPDWRVSVQVHKVVGVD